MDAIIPNPTIVSAIQSRRTIKEFRSDPIPEETLGRILDAARWAPNHRLTEPWRIAIIGTQSREALADALANLTASSEDSSVMAKAKDEAQSSRLAEAGPFAVCLLMRGPADGVSAAALQEI